jgi:hypothetical protein
VGDVGYATPGCVLLRREQRYSGRPDLCVCVAESRIRELILGIGIRTDEAICECGNLSEKFMDSTTSLIVKLASGETLQFDEIRKLPPAKKWAPSAR